MRALARLRECETRLAAHDDGPPRRAPRATRSSASPTIFTPRGPRRPPTCGPSSGSCGALIEEIVLDVDDDARDIVFDHPLARWTALRVAGAKPQTGEHSRRASQEADQLIRSMATRWSDADVAATLNRLAIPTGQGNTWTPMRVAAYRQKSGIPAAASSVRDGRCLTVVDAATKLGVTRYMIHALIDAGILPAHQIVRAAPWQILATDLDLPAVQQALRTRARRGRPCRNSHDNRTLTIPVAYGGTAQ